MRVKDKPFLILKKKFMNLFKGSTYLSMNLIKQKVLLEIQHFQLSRTPTSYFKETLKSAQERWYLSYIQEILNLETKAKLDLIFKLRYNSWYIQLVFT